MSWGGGSPLFLNYFYDIFFVGMPGQNLSPVHTHLHTGVRERRTEWRKKEKQSKGENERGKRECKISPNIIWHHSPPWLIPTGMKVLARVLGENVAVFCFSSLFFSPLTPVLPCGWAAKSHSALLHTCMCTHCLSLSFCLSYERNSEPQLWLKFTFDFCQALKELLCLLLKGRL